MRRISLACSYAITLVHAESAVTGMVSLSETSWGRQPKLVMYHIHAESRCPIDTVKSHCFHPVCVQALKGFDATMRDGSRFFIQQHLLAAVAVPVTGNEAEHVSSGGPCVVQEALAGQLELQSWLREGLETALSGAHSAVVYLPTMGGPSPLLIGTTSSSKVCDDSWSTHT